jgi:hypothetical protein
MLVYGDQERLGDPSVIAIEINERLGVIERDKPGIDRHSKLANVLVEAGELLQGIADFDFDEATCDRRVAKSEQLELFVSKLALALCQSWDSRFRELPPLPRLEVLQDWPAEVKMRVPEGFAFYALYAEAYLEAARRLELKGSPRVIGIRSIGTSLAAVVAAAIGAEPPITLRPFGNVFERRIAIEPELERELLEGNPHYVIVDEGPGQSGSSVGAVADWLCERGVTLERIALLPSHGGLPGPEATAARTRLWQTVQRRVGDFGEQWPELIGGWCEASIGPLVETPLDISGGAWRKLKYETEDEWPASIPAFERRKFLVRSGKELFLLKFAGLGAIGERKLAIARVLHAEGLVPEPITLVHGFLVERWCADAVPLGNGDRPLREIGRYIGTRGRLLGASNASGASIETLLAMARRNISLEFGNALLNALEPWEHLAPSLEGAIVRLRTDNKLDRHEWLRARHGALLKSDALDHHQAHDLIGCQDLAWDVAAAIVEFELRSAEADELVAATEHWAGRPLDRDLIEFYLITYLAFRIGHARLGTNLVDNAREHRRLSANAGRYAARLEHLLQHGSCPTRRTSLVD